MTSMASVMIANIGPAYCNGHLWTPSMSLKLGHFFVAFSKISSHSFFQNHFVIYDFVARQCSKQ